MISNRFLAAALAVAGIVAVSGAAQAECRRHSGYIFVQAFCSTQTVRHPDNPCERGRGDPPSVVAFFSPVIRDSADNRIYPAGVFYDQIQIQYDLSKNGQESACFATREEAEQARRQAIADSKRQRNRVLYVSMPNT